MVALVAEDLVPRQRVEALVVVVVLEPRKKVEALVVVLELRQKEAEEALVEALAPRLKENRVALVVDSVEERKKVGFFNIIKIINYSLSFFYFTITFK